MNLEEMKMLVELVGGITGDAKDILLLHLYSSIAKWIIVQATVVFLVILAYRVLKPMFNNFKLSLVAYELLDTSPPLLRCETENAIRYMRAGKKCLDGKCK